MKLIGLEEHFATPEMVRAWLDLPKDRQDLAIPRSTGNDKEKLLKDLADERIAAMDAAGIDVQVISPTTPGVQSLEAEEGVRLARAANDVVAATVRHRPDRFQGLATLPFQAPETAARELERAVVELGLHGAMVFGRVGEKNIDHLDFLPILETAARLRAPLYIHPQTPQMGVREAYYQGVGGALGEEMEGWLATSGLGWHYESGMQGTRLVLSGVFERLPDLRIILGHWGEVVLFYSERLNLMQKITKLPRPPSEYFQSNMWVTPSGFFSRHCMQWAIEVMGIDRVMFATDYPFVLTEKQGARHFLESSGLSDADQNKIASGNWEKLISEIRR